MNISNLDLTGLIWNENSPEPCGFELIERNQIRLNYEQAIQNHENNHERMASAKDIYRYLKSNELYFPSQTQIFTATHAAYFPACKEVTIWNEPSTPTTVKIPFYNRKKITDLRRRQKPAIENFLQHLFGTEDTLDSIILRLNLAAESQEIILQTANATLAKAVSQRQVHLMRFDPTKTLLISTFLGEVDSGVSYGVKL